MSGIEKLLLRDSRVEELLTVREMEHGEASDFIIPYALQTHREEFRKLTILYKSICQGKELVGFLILTLDPDGSSVELRRIVVSRPGHGIGKRALPFTHKSRILAFYGTNYWSGLSGEAARRIGRWSRGACSLPRSPRSRGRGHACD